MKLTWGLSALHCFIAAVSGTEECSQGQGQCMADMAEGNAFLQRERHKNTLPKGDLGEVGASPQHRDPSPLGAGGPQRDLGEVEVFSRKHGRPEDEAPRSDEEETGEGEVGGPESSRRHGRPEDEEALPGEALHLRAARSRTALDTQQAGMVDSFLEERLWTFERPGRREAGSEHAPRRDLTFIHIPRCAGSSIEDCSANESQSWGHLDADLQGLFELSGGHRCSKHHVPPTLLPGYYGGKETFCVVRNPYERMISEFHFPLTAGFAERARAHRCTAEGLNEFTLATLGAWDSNPWINDCHVLPQVAYVYGWDGERNVVDQAQTSCTHMLRQESLEADFDALMAKNGYSYRLTSHVNPNTVAGSYWNCTHVTPRDFSPEAVALINKVWADDFRLLGYYPIEL